MIVAIPFCDADYPLALDLVKWIKSLGGCPNHDCVLVSDFSAQWSNCVELLTLSNQTFRSAKIISTDESVVGWPQGANALWMTMAKYAKEVGSSWLFLEPDAIPLKPGWLDELDAAYQKSGARYFGHIYSCDTPGLPPRLMSGVAVYPAVAYRKIGEKAFDVELAPITCQETHTNLIHHIWGYRNDPPSFKEHGVPGSHVYCLCQIHPEAVIFHRNKDGTLMRMLRKKFGLFDDREFVVTIPFCNQDGSIQLKNVKWMSTLQQPKTHDAILSYEQGCAAGLVDSIRAHAIPVFKSVSEFSYPRSPNHIWPQAPNHAFQHLAMYMYEQVKRPWLFLEYDEIPVASDWLIQLQDEYYKCKKPFMGHQVEMLGHMNGGGIYPYNFPEYSPKGMMADTLAWDWVCKEDIVPHLHAANHLIEQCTKVINGTPNIHQGDVPTFRNQGDVDRLLKPGIVLFHRCKDGTLIQRLTERMKRR